MSANHQLGIVVNPSKFSDLAATKRQVEGWIADAGWPAPNWYETTPDDMGVSMAKSAIEDGATVVASFGGDGTVRGVASVLAGTDIPLGLLPGGTGNLLARNLDVPLDLKGAVQGLLSGGERKIDTAIAQFTRKDRSRFEERFLVMAGVGLDAEIMSSTSNRLKSRIGWFAYVVSAIPRISRWGFRARLANAAGEQEKRRCQVVVFGNCGTITGGIKVMPDARIDDGLVDALAVSVEGFTRWPVAMATLMTTGPDDPKHVHRGVSRGFRLGLRKARLAQVDGDPVGKVMAMDVEADPQSLIVRVPVG